MRTSWGVILFTFFLGGSSAAGLGCSDCRVDGQDPIVYEGGFTNESRTIFQSSAPDAEMLHFPQGRIYQFYHGLGVIPIAYQIYVSFKEQLVPGDDPDDKKSPNNISLAAGNQALIEVLSEDMIQIRNDTCENNFYVRLVAMADPDAVTQGEGGQGGSEGSSGAD